MVKANPSYAVRLLSILSVCATLAACGGSSDEEPNTGNITAGTQYVAATSNSFSPNLAKDANNNATPVYWKYRINEGKPINTLETGTNVSAVINDFELSFDPISSTRAVHLEGQISGDAVGSIHIDSEESIVISEGTTSIRNQNISAKIAMQGTNIDFSSNSEFQPPFAEWFIDREELDTLELDQDFISHASAQTRASLVVNNQPLTNGETLTTETNETWRLIEKLPSYTVLDNTYKNVIRVSRSTSVPNPYTGTSKEVTMTYWVAKGIGMIKGIGQFPILDRTDLVVELLETNLSAASQENITGTWQGQMISSREGSSTVTMILSQNDRTISGTYTNTAGAQGSLSGSITGTRFTITMDYSPSCSITAEGTISFSTPMSLSGSYSTSSTCSWSDTGTGNLTKL